MASENMDAWASRAIVDIETIHAVVKAYAEGKIQLQAVGPKIPKSKTRYAPSFLTGDLSAVTTSMPYTGREIRAVWHRNIVRFVDMLWGNCKDIRAWRRQSDHYRSRRRKL